MAKGKASLSSSGASMSKYDVEVEARLKALEAQAHPDRCNDGGDGGDSETVRIIEAVLRKIHPNWEKLVAKERAGG